MTPAALQQYLHEHIPLSAAMQVAVLSAGEAGVVLQAPLGPNINHRDTVFGGSASALAILAAWSQLHWNLTQLAVKARVVIQRNTLEYLRPIDGAFVARSASPSPVEWARFLRTLERHGKARLAVRAQLEHAGQLAGRFHGDFVALS